MKYRRGVHREALHHRHSHARAFRASVAAMRTVEEALVLAQRGDLNGAEDICERRLARHPDDIATLSLLAEVYAARADHERAAVLLGRLVALTPADAAAQRRLAASLLALDRADAAAAALRTSLVTEPRNARAHNNLGRALAQLGRTEEAIDAYTEALRLQPNYAIAWNNLGMAHEKIGAADKALDCFRQAIAEDPALTPAAVNLAIALERRGLELEALHWYDSVLARAPPNIEAWSGRGALLAKLGRFAQALEDFNAALRLEPGNAAVLIQKAMALLALERAAEALRCADLALCLDSTPAVHNARGGALRKLGRHAEAVGAIERALELDPGFIDGWRNLGTLLHESGEDARAVAACRRAAALDPDDIQTRTRLLARLIPAVPLTEGEAVEARRRFDRYLDEFDSWRNSRGLTTAEALIAAQQQLFYLSYEEACHRTVLSRYRTACADSLAAFIDEAPAPPRRAAEAADTRLRLGFVSAQIYDHSVFNAILRGWLDGLDRERFAISLFSLGTKQDGLTAASRASVEDFVSGMRSVRDWTDTIRARELDALIFPELGMNEPTLALASLRLAPRQLAAWGHPETSGLPTIDVFLSARSFEPSDAQDHYSERLCPLPNLGVHCRPYAAPGVPLDLGSLGIARGGPVFICPGVPFKYRPADDRIFVDIARRIGPCIFVFFQHDAAELSRKLEGRLAAAFSAGGLDFRQHVVFIPWQPRAAFFALLRQADVYLDTIGFSGFNTFMQAIECHLPCVTLEGRFMRGRLGSGILRRLGLPEFIAHSRADYVALAVRLAEDHGYRAQTRARLRELETRVYGDLEPVEALSRELLDGHRG